MMQPEKIAELRVKHLEMLQGLITGTTTPRRRTRAVSILSTSWRSVRCRQMSGHLLATISSRSKLGQMASAGQFSILETVIFGQNTGDLRPINRCLLPTNRSARRCVAERLWSSCQCRRGRAGLRTAHDQFTLTGGITHHGCRIVRKHARHRGPDPVDIPF